MDTPIHQETLRGHKIKIHYDPDAENPRDWDNLGTLVCGHPRYQLGDKHDFPSARDFLLDLLDLDEASELTVEALLVRAEKIAVILPVFLYDHSGLVMNTTGFHCPWDSGQVGFIYVTLKDVRAEYTVKRVSPACRERIADMLRQEVQTFSDYLSGQVYGYVIEKDGDIADSCWGFIGNYEDHCLAEARGNVPVDIEPEPLEAPVS